MLIRVVMFGCIIAGSLCSIVSVLSCVACSLLYISCGLSAVEVNEEVLLIIIIKFQSWKATESSRLLTRNTF